MSDAFGISSGPACRIAVRGEVDADNAPQLEAAIPLSGSVWLDFSAVTFLDSSGLAVLARGRDRAKERGDNFLVSRLTGGPLRVVQMSGMWEMLCAE